MSLLDCRVSLKFSNLQIPNTQVVECLIDLYYEDKKYRLKFPSNDTVIVTLNAPLKKDKNTIALSILVPKGKKYRKLAKGEINIYKKYLFLSQNLSFEKYIYLFTYKNQLNLSMKESNSDNNYPGEILINGKFIDPEQPNDKIMTDNIKTSNIDENYINSEESSKMLKNVIANIPKKEKEKYLSDIKKSLSVNNNPTNADNLKLNINTLSKKIEDEDEIRLIQNITANPRTEIDEDLSDVSISVISEDSDNDNNSNSIDAVNYQVDEMITKLRKYFDENSDSVLPNEPEKLRDLLENLTNQVKSISDTYSQNLQSMSSINKRLKFQAKDYYDRYKELKKNYEKEKKEFLMKNKVLECEDKLNKEENNKISKEINDVKNEIDFFNNKLGLTSDKKDEETEIMLDILKSLKEKNVNIYEGLSKDQIEFLEEIMNDNKKDENNDFNNDNNDISNDSIEGEKYAKAIEDIANRIYSKHLIPDIKIEQIESNIYSFNDKEVTLKFDENDNVKLLNGTDLETWIVDTFKIQQTPKAINVVNKNKKTTSGGKTTTHKK